MGEYYGVGVYRKGKYTASSQGKINKEYDTWHSMLRRCYCRKVHAVKPRYADCEVCPEWFDFQEFAEWSNEQVGFSEKGWALDKDILIRGNRLYSPETCVFVPPEINACLILRQNGRGRLPIGVTKYNSIFCAKISEGGVSKTILTSSSVEECFYAYKRAKEAQFKLLAEKYKGVVDSRLYDALNSLQISIED